MKAQTNITRIVFLLCSFFFFLNTSAQVPNAMSYQAVIRNASNVLVSNANVGVRISILQTTATGTVVFSEYHTPTTNANGLATLQIGAGTILTGNFATINWANGPFFIKTETDPTGGTNYTISGTSQLLSVPFALYAASSGSSASNWTTTGSNIANNNTGNVGIGTGTTIPSSLLTVKEDGIGFTQEDNVGTNQIGFYTDNTSAYLQTHSNTDLSFSTNNGVAKMTLQKVTGNFGIGITAPTEKLEVNGKTKTTNLQVTTGSGTGKVLTSDATGNATWQDVSTSNSWSTTGNAATNANTNFIGTTDNVDLVFKRNNAIAGRIGSSNTSLGSSSLNPASTGLYNAAFGSSTLLNNTTGGFNTANGYFALKNNTTGSGNTSIGYGTLQTNNTGSNNTANGSGALSENSSGYSNTAIGSSALGNNTIGFENTAIGNSTLSGNFSGSGNTAVGFEALNLATSNANTAVGTKSLWKNTTGNLNVALGGFALNKNTIGYENTALGYNALPNLINGINNVAIGISAGSNIQFSDNNIIIGSYAMPPNSISNQVQIGNSSITYAGIQTAWSITSDKRLKNNIHPSNLGLDFIKKLNPVSYIRNNDSAKKIEFGFIAQELEETLLNFNVQNNGIITKSDAGMYSVRYNDLLSPMVKAIQELEVENQTLKSQNQELEKRLKAIEDKLIK